MTKVRQILEHIGVRRCGTSAMCRWAMGDGVKVELDWDEAAQPAPDFEVDQRVSC